MNNTKLVSALAVIAILGTSLAASAAGDRGRGGMMGGMDRGFGPDGAIAGMAFEQMDTDGNGTVPPEELAAAAQARFAAADANGDGLLSAEELAAAAERLAEERQARLRAAMTERMLDRMDDNGDGQLSADEMRVARAGENFFERFDTDGDGNVSAEEFEQASKRLPRFGDRDRGEHRRRN